MAKTANSSNARRTKMELAVSTAMAAALAGLTTAEDIDISSIHVEITQGQVSQREIDETYVTGDLTAILTPDGVVSAEKYSITILWTQGKDTLGTDAIDIYSDLLLPVHLQGTAFPIQHKWSPAGGNVGDEQYVTSPTETYLLSCPKPVGGASSDKVKITYEIITPVVTEPVIIT